MATVIAPERPDSPEAMRLINELDAYLVPLYPVESQHGYAVERLLAEDIAFFVTRQDGIAVGCGGIRLFGTEYGEIKRMYVRPESRGLGLGKLMLENLARYAKQHRIGVLRLETGIHQEEAIALYERMGFSRRGPFGDYVNDPNSLYFEKRLK